MARRLQKRNNADIIKKFTDKTSVQYTMAEYFKNKLSFGLETEVLVTLIFNNRRSQKLTNFGLQLFSSEFEKFMIKLPADYKVKSSHILYLDKYLKRPYYIDATKIILFDSADSFELFLFDNDLDGFVEMKKMSEKDA